MEEDMRRSSLVITVVLFLSVLFIGVSLLPEAKAITRYVGGAGPGNYTTIQGAIDDALPGDTVYVYNGTYVENVVINKTISLAGEDATATVVDASGGGDGIHISSDWVNVTGFTVKRSGSPAQSGIELQAVENCYIANNSVEANFTLGIYLWSTSSNSVVNNTVSDDYYGISLLTSTNDRILNNTVRNGRWGIDIRDTSTSTIKGNTMVNTGIFVSSFFLTEMNTHTIDTSNTVNGKPVYYWKNVSGGNVPSGAGEVILVNCTDVKVENQNLSDGTVGIQVAHSSNITVSNNTASNGRYGFYVSLTHNSIFSHNNISHNSDDGIYLEWSHGNTFHNNTAIGNNIGFEVYWSDGNRLVDNTARDNAEGFDVLLSEENTFDHNNATGNGGSGFQLWYAERSNITNCNISGNWWRGIALLYSEYNTIEDNYVSGNFRFGIGFYGSGNNTVSNNTLLSNQQEGINLLTSNDNTIVNNTVLDSISGINVTLSNANVIEKNDAVSNSIGISLDRSSHNIIQANNASGNTWGVTLYNSVDNQISNNTANGNVYGVYGKGLNDVAIRDNAALNNTIAMALSDSLNVTIHKNNASGLLTGIDLLNVNESTVSNNTSLHNSWEGIKVGFSSNVTIEGNMVWESRRGVWIDHSTRNTVTGNTLVRTGIALTGRSLQYWNTHTIGIGNAVNGKPAYYWKDRVGGTVPFGAGQVMLANCSGVEVRNQNVSNTSAGIQVGFSSGISIVNNTARGAHVEGIGFIFSDDSTVDENVISSDRWRGYGLHLDYSNDNLVANNTVMTNWFGILADLSEANDIRGNSVSDSEHGIHLSDSNHNTIYQNEVHDNEDGIHLHYSVNNTIDGNAAHSNVVGIYIRQSDDNVIRRNNVSINAVGIGAYASYGNRIYHNRLSGNTVQGYDDRDANQWDDGYPSAGNHWSDYAGVDLKWGPDQNLTGSDGIGDTPYVIDADSQDRYPLMMPFVPSARPPVASGARLSGNGLENVTVEWLLSPDDGGGYYSVVEYEIYRGATYDSDGLSYELIASVANGTSTFTDTLAGEGEPNNYFYLVCAVDRDNFTACARDQAGKFTRPLAPRPSLISIPLAQSDESVETVLQTVEYDTVWYYDSFTQEWKWYMKDKTYSGGLSDLNHMMGVWVNVTQDCNLTMAGVVPAQTTIQLRSGWNMVSFPSINTTYTVAYLKAETGATRVEGYDPAPPYFLRVLGDAEVLQAGSGYWVRVEADTIWTVSFA